MYIPEPFKEDRIDVLHDPPRRLGDPDQPDFGRTDRQPYLAAARPRTSPVWDSPGPSRTSEPGGARCGRRRSGDFPWAGFLHHAVLVSEQARDREVVPTWNYVAIH